GFARQEIEVRAIGRLVAVVVAAPIDAPPAVHPQAAVSRVAHPVGVPAVPALRDRARPAAPIGGPEIAATARASAETRVVGAQQREGGILSPRIGYAAMVFEVIDVAAQGQLPYTAPLRTRRPGGLRLRVANVTARDVPHLRVEALRDVGVGQAPVEMI